MLEELQEVIKFGDGHRGVGDLAMVGVGDDADAESNIEDERSAGSEVE